MSQNDIPYVYIGLGYTAKLLPKRKVDGSAFPLTGTIEVQFWQYGNDVAPVKTLTVGAGLASVNATESSITFDMDGTSGSVGTGNLVAGFGTMVVNRTGSPTVRLLDFPVRFAAQSETLPADNDGTCIIPLRDYVVTVESRYLDNTVNTAGIVDSAVTTAKLADNAVTNAKLADVATGTVKARLSAGSGDPEDVTLAALKTAMIPNVDDTSDLNKPLSTATIAALAGKSNVGHTHTYAEVSGNPTELTRGALALARLRQLVDPGRKFLIADFVSGGYAEGDGATGHRLLSIENVPGATISTPANGTALGTDRRIITYAANALRYSSAFPIHPDTSGLGGRPRGVLFEPQTSYLNKKSPAALADYDTRISIQNASAPPGESGSWVEPTGSGVLSLGYISGVTLVANQPYAIRMEVWTADGEPPVYGVTGPASLVPNIGGWAIGKKQSDGSTGWDVEGRLANGLWVVKAYVQEATYPNDWYGFVRYAACTGPLFKIRRINLTQGRYSPSFFDNATTSGNTRAADRYTIPVSGFTFDELTMIIEHDAAGHNGSSPCAAILRNSATGLSDSVGFWSVGGSGDHAGTVFGVYHHSSGSALTTAQSGLVRGQRYLAGVSMSRSDRRCHGKILGIAAAAPQTMNFASGLAPNILECGHYNGVAQLESTLRRVIILDQYLSPADLAAITG